ncbi:prepilin peptidase [Parafrigoribacterium mesophilum]|uniref:prepilin peptidase n=1 Tax=Parafrigoribacterium mesophilum TaxID=433646 RepID=UPI0031FCB0BF
MPAILAGGFGLLIGSFLNVVAYRVPLRRSIVSPPSACPTCGTAIKGYDNIPVLSWLMLRGRCRNCASPISVRYPIVELGTGLLFAAVALWFGVSTSSTTAASSTGGVAAWVLGLIAFLYLAAISVVLALIDLDTHTLPNRIVLPSYIVGVALLGMSSVLAGDYGQLLRAGIGMAALWLAYLAMAFAYPGGMGFGDVKLAGVLGLYLAWLGWGTLIVGAFAAFLLGGLFAVGLLIARKAGRKSGIPFGPWMLLGCWVGTFFGDSIARGYLVLVGLG